MSIEMKTHNLGCDTYCKRCGKYLGHLLRPITNGVEEGGSIGVITTSFTQVAYKAGEHDTNEPCAK
jgi:hypothetical protein